MGGSSQGSTTTIQNSTPWNAQALADYQIRAVGLARDNPFQYYPGATLQAPSNSQQRAATDLANVGLVAGDAIGSAVPEAQHMALTRNAILANGGGVQAAQPQLDRVFGLLANNPTVQGMSALNPVATGQYISNEAPLIGELRGVAHGTAADSLSNTATGHYLNSNLYLNGMFNSASDAVTRAYKTATAPQTDSAMESANRFGSGALSNARSQNEANLGNALSNMGANIYGTNYGNERALMNSAATGLGSLQTNALLGTGGLYGNAVNTLSNAGSNLGQLGALGQNSQIAAGSAGLSNYANLLTGQQAAINATPAQTGMATTDYNTGLQGGNTLQQQQQSVINDEMSRYYGNQQAPWTTAQTEAGIIGSAIPGVSSTQTPYFTNPLGQALGAAGAVAQIAPLITGGQ